MSTYREAGRAKNFEARSEAAPDDRPRVNRRELALALLPLVVLFSVPLALAIYGNVLPQFILLVAARLACGMLIAKVGLAIQTRYYKRKPDFGRDLLAQETEAFLKQAEEAEARELRKRVFLVPARVAPVESAAVANDASANANDEDARSVGKAEPW